MTQLVTLDEAKLYIRVTADWDDAQILIMIAAASEAALAVADGWDGAGEPPARLKMAVLSHVAAFYGDREGIAAPAGIAPLLAPLRTIGV